MGRNAFQTSGKNMQMASRRGLQILSSVKSYSFFMDIPDIDRAQLSYGRLNFTRQKDKLLQHVHAEHWQVNGPCPARTSVGNIFSMKTIIEWTRQGPPLRVDLFPSRKTERQRCGGSLAKWTSLASCLKSSSGSPFLKGRFWCPQKLVTRTWPLFIRKPQSSRISLCLQDRLLEVLHFHLTREATAPPKCLQEVGIKTGRTHTRQHLRTQQAVHSAGKLVA